MSVLRLRDGTLLLDPGSLVARFVGRGVGKAAAPEPARVLGRMDKRIRNAGYVRKWRAGHLEVARTRGRVASVRWRRQNVDVARKRTRDGMRRLRARRRREALLRAA